MHTRLKETTTALVAASSAESQDANLNLEEAELYPVLNGYTFFPCFSVSKTLHLPTVNNKYTKTPGGTSVGKMNDQIKSLRTEPEASKLFRTNHN